MRRESAPRGYVLLEALIATTLMVLGLAIVGSAVQKAYFESLEMERRTRALMLAESKLAELDTGLIQFESLDELMEEPFGPLFPDWGYTIRIQPTVTPGLNQIRLQILYFMRNYDTEEFDFDKARVIHELFTFRMTPRRIDLATDYGLDEEAVTQLSDLLGSVGLEIPPEGFPLQDFLRSADVEAIMQLMSNEELLASMGFSRDDILARLPREVRQALGALSGESEDEDEEDE